MVPVPIAGTVAISLLAHSSARDLLEPDLLALTSDAFFTAAFLPKLDVLFKPS